ncbi:glycoside hydrolase family 13 protein [Williamwhitmania taraxaci]|uniref:Glycosidase n=1 Tax=Williamwhitmania taraxaci TaxID=1640674 RepID=A0A1G6HU56_9BACT|nr:glycoside hydrolase family 13 protein [Williamwhitmania taraxaci]SDB97762.1 Glycosidase [Williamwhitmania taraxaci]
MTKKSFLLFSLVVLSMASLFAQKPERIDPPFWWTGMKDGSLQLVIYGKGIATTSASISYPGVSVRKEVKPENPNYIFLYLGIMPEAKPGMLKISFTKNGKQVSSVTYELKARIEGSAERKGFSSEDVVYLIMPDRFANGDLKNDKLPNYKDTVDRKDQYARHGGDIKGIEKNIDYIKNLGVTAVWFNPMDENNMDNSSYHGYAITDYYKTDSRFGSNADYKGMVDKFHSNGIKVIKDMVFNHCGSQHWWIKDLPSKDWLNQWPEYTNSSFRAASISDPHAAKSDIKKMANGWFVPSMPDLNQRNPLLADYLVQNSIWWIEFSGIDGIRMDTHPYPDADFMSIWGQKLMLEYPNLNIVGEVWMNQPAWVSYWQMNSPTARGYNSNLPTVMDFPLMGAIEKAFDEPASWDTGLIRLYDIISQDFLYANTNNIMVFADNHDLSRLFKTNEAVDINKYKMVMTFLLTTRGIPQFYYGNEILMAADKANGDGNLRKDFPGGWPSDTANAFLPEGRTQIQNEAYTFFSKLAKWRKESPALTKGSLIQFVPEENVYVYFRVHAQQTVMVVLNASDKDVELGMKRFNEVLNNTAKGFDILKKETLDITKTVMLPARSSKVILLEN